MKIIIINDCVWLLRFMGTLDLQKETAIVSIYLCEKPISFWAWDFLLFLYFYTGKFYLISWCLVKIWLKRKFWKKRKKMVPHLHMHMTTVKFLQQRMLALRNWTYANLVQKRKERICLVSIGQKKKGEDFAFF